MTVPLSTVKTLLFNWVEAATGLDNNKIVFAYPNGPEPTGPHFVINPARNITRIGQDEEQPATGEDLGKIEVISRRYVYASFHCHANNAMELMSAVQDACFRPSIYTTFQAQNISIQVEDIKDLSAIKSARFEGRAQMDVRIACGSSFVDDMGWFDTVTLTLTVGEREDLITVQGD